MKIFPTTTHEHFNLSKRYINVNVFSKSTELSKLLILESVTSEKNVSDMHLRINVFDNRFIVNMF